MTPSQSTPRHPIRVVAQRTGLTPATIRAWERRYSAVTPGRSEGGQRVYSDQDVDRLSTLRRLTEAGRQISTVAELSDEAAAALLTEDWAARAATALSPNGQEAAHIVDHAYGRVLDRDGEGLERALWRAALSLDSRIFLDDVAAPLLGRIGGGWVAGELDPGQEHLASDVIDGVLARMAEPARWSDGPGLVVATLPGERHGLGARLVSAVASVEGWRVTYLGTDLPPADIARTAHEVQAGAVAISMVSRDLAAEAMRSLVTLRGLLKPTVHLFVGGGGARDLDTEALAPNIVILDGLEPFRGVRSNGF